MLIFIDPHSGVPVYRQIMDQIMLLVASGALKAGDELPSTRNLSAELGVNPMTISKAYSYLERDGVVERRPGRPLVISEFSQAENRDMKLEQLRQSLGPVVQLIRQLEIDAGRAVEMFADMLAEGQDDEKPDMDMEVDR